MRPNWIAVAVVAVSLCACGGPKNDERHLDGIDLSNARIAEFRERFGPEEEIIPIYVLGLPIYKRHRFKLAPEDARRFSGSSRGPLFVD